MRNVMLSALALSTLLLGGCDPEPVDTVRADVESTPTTIPHPPTDIVVLLDTSHSMTRHQLSLAETILDRLLGVVDEDDRFALVTIRTEATVVIEPGAAAPEAKHEWMQTIGSLEGTGLTNLEAGLELAQTIASAEARVLFIGDGSPTWGNRETEELVALASGLNLWTVGVGRHDETFLRRLGHYVEAGDPFEVAAALVSPDATAPRSPRSEHRDH